MSRVAVLAGPLRAEGFGLAGAVVVAVDDSDGDAVRQAWRGLPHDVAVVILSGAAAAALPARTPDDPLTVVLPDG